MTPGEVLDVALSTVGAARVEVDVAVRRELGDHALIVLRLRTFDAQRCYAAQWAVPAVELAAYRTPRAMVEHETRRMLAELGGVAPLAP